MYICLVKILSLAALGSLLLCMDFNCGEQGLLFTEVRWLLLEGLLLLQSASSRPTGFSSGVWAQLLRGT